MPDTYTCKIVPLYKKQILTYIDYNKGRDFYQIACVHIKQLMQLDKKVANDLILELQKTYSKRKALIEELSYISNVSIRNIIPKEKTDIDTQTTIDFS